MSNSSSIMPLIAQSFVESRSRSNRDSVTFDMVASASALGGEQTSRFSSSTVATQTPSPRHNLKLNTPRSSSSRKSDRSHSSPSGSSEIFSLSDSQLADKYQFLEEVGFGNWGSVWKCRPKSQVDGEASSTSNDSHVAVKLVHRSKDPTSSARVRSLWTEYKSVKALNSSCESLIYFDTFTITPSYALIVMDYHPRLIPVEMSESKAKPYFRQLISAVEYLHKKGCSHNDIKPANILLSSNDIPVLVDFGFAQRYANKSDEFQSCLSWGTVEYLSPERAKGFLHNEALSDIWALGVTMYEIVVGRTPFEANQSEEFLTKDAVECYYQRTLTGNFYGEIDVSTEFRTLIRSLVEPRVSIRLPSCGSALRHKFFEDSANSVSTPIRLNTRLASTRVSTPTSSARKVLKKSPAKLVKVGLDDEIPSKKSKPIAIYHDPVVDKTPIKSSPSKTTPSRILTPIEKENSPIKTTYSSPIDTPILKSKPQAQLISKIPIRSSLAKFDPSTPIKSKPIILSPTGLRSPLGSNYASTREGTINTSAKENQAIVNTIRNPIVKTTETISASTSPDRRICSPKTLLLSEIVASRSRTPVRMDSLGVIADGEKKSGEEKVGAKEMEGDIIEVLESKPIARESSLLKVPQNLPSTPLKSQSFRRLSAGARDRKLSDTSSINSTSQPLQMRSISRQDSYSLGRASPIPKSNIVSSRLRQLSIRRPPSPLSFKGIRDTISNASKRRSTSTASIFSTFEEQPLNPQDPDSMTMPIDFKNLSSDSIIDVQADKARLESFSQHIQNIIDRNTSPNSIVKNSIGSRRIINEESKTQRSILSPVEIQEFRQQVSRELEAESRQKIQAKEQQGPRPRVGSGSLLVTNRNLAISKPMAPRLPLRNRVPVKIRPSASPSFVRNRISASPKKPQNRRISATLTPLKKPISPFKPGHRRIPTAIRSVPSIILNESADEASDDENESDVEGPHRRGITPPPRVVEEARQLPTWVPNSVDSDSEENNDDTEEATITISTPMKLIRRASVASKIPGSIDEEPPSSPGLYQQFVKATPGIERAVTPRVDEVVSIRTISRASSSRSGVSLTRQVSRLFSVSASKSPLNSEETKVKEGKKSGWKNTLKRFLN